VNLESKLAQKPIHDYYLAPILWNTSAPIIIVLSGNAFGVYTTHKGKPIFALIYNIIFEATDNTPFGLLNDAVTITYDGIPSSLQHVFLIAG